MSVGAARPIELLLVDDDENDVIIMREALKTARVSTWVKALTNGSDVTP